MFPVITEQNCAVAAPDTWRRSEMSGTGGTGGRMCGWASLAAVMLSLLTPARAFAQKVDVVTLKNGDHLTCEIKKLDQGRLTVSTDALDKVVVYWQDVGAVTSPREFEVTLASGDKYYGALGTSQAGEVVITTYPLPPQTASLDDVTG